MGKDQTAVPRHPSGGAALRVLLAIVLAASALTLYLDIRARNLFNDAKDRLAATEFDEQTDAAAIQQVMQRNPTNVKDAAGGQIEVYTYRSALPWRSYAIHIGYLKDTEERLSYLDHNVDDPQGEFHLEQVIGAHRWRALHPPVEQPPDLDGAVTVGVDEEYRGRQRGSRLVLAYDGESRSFSGSVRNMTRDTLRGVRVMVRFPDRTEVGPQLLGDLEAGTELAVQLDADREFDSWRAYVDTNLYLNETYQEVHYGAEISMAYDVDAQSFKGRVRNTSSVESIDGLRVAIRLSDGTELGPAVLESLQPGSETDVVHNAAGHKFRGWSVRASLQP